MYSAIASSLWGQPGETEDEPDSYLAFTASATSLRVHQHKSALIFSPARTPTLGSQPKFCLDSRISEPKWTSVFPSSGRREARGSLSDSFLLMNCVHLLSETHTHSHTQAHTSLLYTSLSQIIALFTERPFMLSENCGNLLDKVSNHPRSLSFPLHAELSLPPYPHYLQFLNYQVDFPCRVHSKESACNVGDLGSIPGSGRFPGEENDNPLQYSCLENPRDRGAWQSMGSQRVRHDWATFTQFQPSSSSCFLVPVFVFTDPHRIFFRNRISLSFVLC